VHTEPPFIWLRLILRNSLPKAASPKTYVHQSQRALRHSVGVPPPFGMLVFIIAMEGGIRINQKEGVRMPYAGKDIVLEELAWKGAMP
jgi:hypothetical protein